jgi:exodeoxyribonuclease VII large subunit
MVNQMIASQFISLYYLCVLIREVVGENFPDPIWIVAEIANIKENQNGHCYLELVDKNEEKIIAQARATIWAYNYRSLAYKFEKATGETLKRGMKILFSAQVQYHEVYGLSLNIKDIDPNYSTGEMARKKRETVERLSREGLLELNKSLLLPLVPQRIAIISSPTAAGYGDFMTHLKGKRHQSLLLLPFKISENIYIYSIWL